MISPHVRGRMEGWVWARLPGQTDWKKLWMVVCRSQGQMAVSSSNNDSANPFAVQGTSRIRSWISRSSTSLNPVKSLLAFYTAPKGSEFNFSPKEKLEPTFTMSGVTQAYAVFPDQLDLVKFSTLMKLWGSYGNDGLKHSHTGREGWLMIMPMAEPRRDRISELLKWLVGTLRLASPRYSEGHRTISQKFTTHSDCMADHILTRGTLMTRNHPCLGTS